MNNKRAIKTKICHRIRNLISILWTKSQNLKFDKRGNCFVCENSRHYTTQCRHGRRNEEPKIKTNLVNTNAIATMVSSNMNMISDVRD